MCCTLRGGLPINRGSGEFQGEYKGRKTWNLSRSDRHVIRNRARQPKSGERQETAGAPSMATFDCLRPSKVQRRVF
jgi:hypothetical protein